MSKPKVKNNYRKILFFVALFCSIIIFTILIPLKKPQIKASLINVSKKRITMYPRQYSDIHQTPSAMDTNSRFKNISIIDNQSLLGNIISSVVGGESNNQMESGTWLWTPLISITPSYRDYVINGAKQNGITAIYLSLDSYLDVFTMPTGSARDEAKEKFDQALEDFIAEAHSQGIAVDAEGGWQNWAEPGNEYKPEALLEYVIKFNQTHSEKLRGFQYDVESYLLPQYQNDKQIIFYNFVYLVDKTVAKLSGTGLQFSVVIPDFFDGESNETPQFSYRGETGYVVDHLLRVLGRRDGSRLIVMSYRNISRGDDGTIDISRSEIEKANSTNTKVIIAQETGDVLPQYVTFFNTSRKYYDRQVSQIKNTFAADKSFAGIATHYINSFLELK